MATKEMTRDFGRQEVCALCAKEALGFGPPRLAICADCTDALAHAHGLHDSRVAELSTRVVQLEDKIEDLQKDLWQLDRQGILDDC